MWTKYFRTAFAVLGAVGLLLWALSVSMGTGIGYNHPSNFLDYGVAAGLWRLAKVVFLGTTGIAVSQILYDHMVG